MTHDKSVGHVTLRLLPSWEAVKSCWSVRQQPARGYESEGMGSLMLNTGDLICKRVPFPLFHSILLVAEAPSDRKTDE